MIQTVNSTDGTPIAFEITGSGSPLVMVHGTGSDHTRWALVLPELAKHFTVCMLDRRGHGISGDAPAYSIEREYEDIAAVAKAAAEIATGSPDAPVDVLGHSFGAACVLGASSQILNVHKLVLYEPPMLREQQSEWRTERIDRMDQALAAGDREAVVVILMHEMLGVPMAGVERARSMPAWVNSVSAAHTIPRELRVSDAYGQNPDAFRAMRAPTLFLLGAESSASFKVTTETLCGLLPNSQVAALPGQQHSAMLTAPALFAEQVIRFLTVDIF